LKNFAKQNGSRQSELQRVKTRLAVVLTGFPLHVHVAQWAQPAEGRQCASYLVAKENTGFAIALLLLNTKAE
jgi:hypothetical protein